MTTTPTFVLGLGGAGTRMTSKVADEVQSEGMEDKFGFYAVDTEGGALETEMKADQYYLLKKPQQGDWSQIIENYDYLNEHHDEGGLQGTSRQRPIARYYLDDANNLSNLIQRLESALEEFAEGAEGDDAYIWVLNSLGGGSGSGLFPALTAILKHTVIPSVISQKATGGVNFEFMGAGALPYVNDLEKPPHLRGNPKYATNAYTALRELRSFQGHDGSESTTLTINNPPQSHQTLSRIELSTPMFQRYFLLSQQEDQTDHEYLNGTVATLIKRYADANKTPDNIPDRDLWPSGFEETGQIYTFWSGRIDVPIDEITELIQFEQQIEAHQEAVEELEEEIKTLEEEIKYAEEVIRSREPSEDSKVSNTAGRKAANYTLAEFTGDEDYDTETVEELVNEDLLDIYPKRNDLTKVDPVKVLKYLYYRKLADTLREERNDHSFVSRIERQWTEIVSYYTEDELAAQFPGYGDLKDPGPMQKWRVVVKPNIMDVRRELEQQDDSGFMGISVGGILDGISSPFGGDDDQPTLEEVENKLTSLQRLANQYSDLESTYERIRGDRKRLKHELQNQKDVLDTQLEQKRTDRENLENRIGEIERRRSGKIEKLANPDHSKKTHAPIDPEYVDVLKARFQAGDADEVTAEDIKQEFGSLRELVEKDIVDVDKLIEMRNEMIEAIHRRDGIIEDQDMDNDILSALIPLINTDNEGLLEGKGDHKSVEEASRFRGYAENHNLEDTFSLRFLGLYTDLDLRNTSELGVVHGYYLQDSERLLTYLGKPSAGMEFIEKRFSYPEVLSEDTALDEAGRQLFSGN